jgi:MFS family permease
MSNIKELLSPYKGLPKEIYVIFISRIINALGCFVMPLLTLILTQKIGVSTETAGFYISISGLLFIPASLLGGKIADVIGRKVVIVVFDLLAAIFYIACSFVEPSMKMMILIMLAGMCMCTAGPAHDSLLADLTTPENRKSAYSMSYMGWNIGFAVGPVLGGMLYIDHLPLVFLGDALTALISLCLITIFIKETIHTTKSEIKDETRKHERRVEGSIFKVLMKRPVLIYFALIAFGYNFVYSQWAFMLPMQASEIFKDAGARNYGLIAGFNGLVVMLFTPIVTKLTEKTGNIRGMVYGGVLYALGFGMLGVVKVLPLFFMCAFIFTIGEIILSININPFIFNYTPSSHRGRMSSILPMILGLGYTLGPMIMGKTLSFISIGAGWIILGAYAFLSSVLMYGLEVYEDRSKVDTAC